MKELSNVELSEIKGGAVSLGLVGLVVGGLIAFAVGILDGLKRPLKCN